MASRQTVGESLRMSNTSGSAFPGTTMRADAFVSNGFSAVLLPSFLSTNSHRDCMTRSCKSCFLSVRQVTMASAGGITVTVAFSCHTFHCLETASRNSHAGSSGFHEKCVVQQFRHIDGGCQKQRRKKNEGSGRNARRGDEEEEKKGGDRKTRHA